MRTAAAAVKFNDARDTTLTESPCVECSIKSLPTKKPAMSPEIMEGRSGRD